ncbi:hypothetical protein PS710_06423 [Pseudomonas fluorescens]|uniref:Uncharacterized protein n=1 Tax=Pseudomonas fluorescens TaxID=294 RepID=A0A5E7FYI8_PSEFL|nr:hypothetical protein PS710_06423 [Pseudomonas fluorescens]
MLQGLLQDFPGLVLLFVGGQGFGFDQIQLNHVVGLFVALCCQTALGFGGPAVIDQDIGLAQLCRQIIVTRPDLGVLDQCPLGVVAFFRDTAEVQVSRIDMAVPGDQVFQITLGLVPGLGFQTHQCQRIPQFVVFRVLLNQARELDLGIGHAVLFDQHARVSQAQAFVVRVLLDAFFQQRQGFIATLERLQQACAQQDRGNFALVRWIVLQQTQRALGVTVLLQQQGLAENQLAVVRVALQQAVEAFHQAVARVLVGIGRGQGEEVEMRVALALQDLLHIGHRIVITPGASQLHRSGPLRLEVVRGVFRPDQRGVQRGLIGAQILGDTKCPLGNARILGVDRLGHVVVQGNVEAIALASQFGAQQAEDGIFAE